MQRKERSAVTRRSVLTAGAIAATTVLAGCDSDDVEVDETTETETTAETITTEPETTTTTETETTAAEASFKIVSIDHPDRVEVMETHEVTISVRNTGGTTGTFNETLEVGYEEIDGYQDVGPYKIEDVPPGETANKSMDGLEFSGGGTHRFRLGETEWEYDVVTTNEPTLSFSGTGQQVEQDVDIAGGLTIVDAEHQGSGNFIVELVDPDSEYDTLFVNDVGSFDGVQADLVESGQYHLDVTADGSWSIEIRQPRGGPGDSLPVSLSGSGPDVIGPIAFEGSGVASGTHDGESNFQVDILPDSGMFGELVFNEIGEFEGETTYDFDGVGWVDINADGDWSIDLE